MGGQPVTRGAADGYPSDITVSSIPRPFTGSTLSALAAGTVDGVWRLWIADDSDGDVGKMGGWSISVGRAGTGKQP